MSKDIKISKDMKQNYEEVLKAIRKTVDNIEKHNEGLKDKE